MHGGTGLYPQATDSFTKPTLNHSRNFLSQNLYQHAQQTGKHWCIRICIPHTTRQSIFPPVLTTKPTARVGALQKHYLPQTKVLVLNVTT